MKTHRNHTIVSIFHSAICLSMASALAFSAILLGAPGESRATLAGATLVTCDTPGGTGGTIIGGAKFAPGITTVERKQTITATTTVTNCTPNEAALDEIAAESKFGVTKTAAGGRPPIAALTIKAKFQTYADCLGLVIPNDPDDTGEYPASGSLTVKWLTAGGGPVTGAVTTKVTAQLDATSTPGQATINGIISKGLGVGGNWTSVAGFSPVATDDKNGNGVSDFLDCTLSADPTAVGKLLDVTSVDGPGPELSIVLP